MARKRLGELLLERGAITREQLDKGLAYQRQSGNRLGAALIEQGVLTEEALCTALAQALGLQVVDLGEVEVEWSALHALRDRFCEANDLFPVSLEEARGRKVLTVAMADPLNLPALEEIEFTTGCKAQVRLATLSQVRAAIRKHYHRQDAGKAKPTSTPPPPARVVPASPFPGLTVSPSALRPPSNPPPARPTGPGAPPPLPVMPGQGEAKPELRPAASDDEPEITSRTALAELIRAKEAQAFLQARATESDLEYLSGEKVAAPGPNDQLERLERKFWALMRIMAKKGLLTREEFLSEFDD